MILFLLPATNSWACTCSSSPGFDYYAYDAAVLVIELEVLDKLPEAQELPAPPSQTDRPGPPRPPVPPQSYETFHIKPLHVFKGELGDINLLRTLNRNSSCYWAPKVGDRFLLYVERVTTAEEESYLIISDACQRHLFPEYQHYQSEIAALQQLQNANNGRFRIESPSGNDRPLVEGRFRKGKPVGQWKVYDLYDPTNSEPLVRFRMRAGKISKMRWTKKTLLPASQRYVIVWKYRSLSW
ncbi:MAG: hypothetical protein AAFZ63_04840 [Bacteroidota bacterium]